MVRKRLRPFPVAVVRDNCLDVEEVLQYEVEVLSLMLEVRKPSRVEPGIVVSVCSGTIIFRFIVENAVPSWCLLQHRTPGHPD